MKYQLLHQIHHISCLRWSNKKKQSTTAKYLIKKYFLLVFFISVRNSNIFPRQWEIINYVQNDVGYDVSLHSNIVALFLFTPFIIPKPINFNFIKNHTFNSSIVQLSQMICETFSTNLRSIIRRVRVARLEIESVET